MSATLGLCPSSVVRVERCVLRVERRSAVLASSSVGEAMCAAVTRNCSISVFSAVEYYPMASISYVRGMSSLDIFLPQQ